nr:MAG TPA: hypothetical protein [Caudoviricetes sp.]
MQTIEETLAKYSREYNKLEDATNAITAARLRTRTILYDNEEPFKLNNFGGKYTGTTIKTPDDVRDMIAGSIIVISGVEWMLRNDGWVSGYGGDRTHEEMFVAMMRHRDHVFLLHEGY